MQIVSEINPNIIEHWCVLLIATFLVRYLAVSHGDYNSVANLSIELAMR